MPRPYYIVVCKDQRRYFARHIGRSAWIVAMALKGITIPPPGVVSGRIKR